MKLQHLLDHYWTISLPSFLTQGQDVIIVQLLAQMCIQAACAMVTISSAKSM